MLFSEIVRGRSTRNLPVFPMSVGSIRLVPNESYVRDNAQAGRG
jgi:hypothetical protein